MQVKSPPSTCEYNPEQKHTAVFIQLAPLKEITYENCWMFPRVGEIITATDGKQEIHGTIKRIGHVVDVKTDSIKTVFMVDENDVIV